MRNLSFALTTAQIRARQKTVTRRRGTWWARVLKPGDLLCAVEKSQGIKKGGLVRLGVIRVVRVFIQPLDALAMEAGYGCSEARAEGFPEMTGQDFVEMFCEHMGGDCGQTVTRIEFEYVEDSPSPVAGLSAASPGEPTPKPSSVKGRAGKDSR